MMLGTMVTAADRRKDWLAKGMRPYHGVLQGMPRSQPYYGLRLKPTSCGVELEQGASDKLLREVL